MHSVPTGTHPERQDQLRRLLYDARRRGNKEDERLVLAWLDDEFVSRAHVRAEDREIKRLRKWLRAAA
jgi:succinate dehydrogenase flavin-adding protein (antitoxin of CptAB toxin-antitoxin module)